MPTGCQARGTRARACVFMHWCTTYVYACVCMCMCLREHVCVCDINMGSCQGWGGKVERERKCTLPTHSQL